MEEKVLGKAKLIKVRCAFANLIEAESYDGNPPKYNITLLIPKKDKNTISAVGTAINEIVNERWPISAKFNAQNQRPPSSKIAFQDGDQKQWDGFPGHWFVHATANPGYEPLVIDNLKQPITKEGVIYGGCYVNAVIKFWGWDNPKGGRGVSASIVAVQFAGRGERFGSAPIDVDSEFDTIPLDGLDEDPLVTQLAPVVAPAIAPATTAARAQAAAPATGEPFNGPDGIGVDDLPF